MINLDAIEARADAATPGPWKYSAGSGSINGTNMLIARGAWPNSGPFIAAARTDVPALIARVRELEDSNDHWAEAWSAAECNGLHTDGTRELGESLGIRKMTADGVARSALQRIRELEAECERLKTFAAQNFSQMLRQEAEQMREYGLSYEGVRKVLHEYNDGEISFGKLMDLIRAAARAMAEDQLSGKTGGLP